MNSIPYCQLNLASRLLQRPRITTIIGFLVCPSAGPQSGLTAQGPLSGLVQGPEQVATLEQVQVPLQRHVDLAVVAGQLGQEAGLEGRAQQAAGNTCTHGGAQKTGLYGHEYVRKIFILEYGSKTKEEEKEDLFCFYSTVGRKIKNYIKICQNKNKNKNICSKKLNQDNRTIIAITCVV